MTDGGVISIHQQQVALQTHQAYGFMRAIFSIITGL